jgi:hypothetical protein
MLGQHSIRYGCNFTLLPRAYQSANLNPVCRAQENTLHLNRFYDQIQEDPEEIAKRNNVRPSLRTRRPKRAACFPLALVAFPYVKWRSFVGPYLYCLARKLD